MRKWKKFLSVFFVLQFFTCSPLVGQTWAASSKTLTRRSSAAKKNLFLTKTSAVTKLTNQELQNCELGGADKKDWAQRLQWFESKIIDRYKAMNKKNILVVGEQKFLNTFKAATKKYNWGSRFIYATTANCLKEILGDGETLVIDARYYPGHFKKIYGNLNVSSFKDVYAEILYDETLTFLKKSGVEYYFFVSPNLSRIKNADAYEKVLISSPDSIDFSERLKKAYNGQDQDALDLHLKNQWPAQHYNGRHRVYDTNTGRFPTENQPGSFKNSVYLYGACTAAASQIQPKFSVATALQNLINKFLRQNYIVENCAINTADSINDFEYILNTTFKPGDIVVEMIDFPEFANKAKGYGFHAEDLSRLFDRPHNLGYWCIDSYGHGLPPKANRLIGKRIYDVIKPQLSKSSRNKKQNTIKYKFENEVDTFVDEHPDFKKFLEKLKNIAAKNNIKGTIGSLNMNANPFTLGHRYLVEEALKEVEHLYLFVVEEDKSEISFKDRYEMIKRGVADLENVTVLTTDKWMCSALTFPDYFDKEHLQDKKLDPTMDIDLYGKYIAPAIGATKRFTREEPFDLITRQHNNFMKNQLPNYGIKFYEIPRKTLANGDVISATKVRNALKAGDFENLKQYVPKTTLNYLKENYARIVKAVNNKYKK